MKISTAIATISLMSTLSFGAFAAQYVDASQAGKLQSVGTITVSGVGGAPADIRQELSAKADAQGATAYRVIELRNEDSYHATAEIYK